MSTVRIHAMGDLIAVIPTVLGFGPQRSVILAKVELDGRLGTVARTDLLLRSDGELSAFGGGLIAEAVRSLASAESGDMVALIVSDQVAADDWQRVLTGVGVAISRAGALPVAVVAADGVNEGDAWRDLYAEESGTVSDRHTVDGYAGLLSLYGEPVASRDELVAVFKPVDHPVDSETVDDAAERAREMGRDSADGLRALIAATSRVRESELSDQEVALLGAALLDVKARDAFLGMALSFWATHARELMGELARRLSGRPRAAAATVLALMAYVDSKGPMVGIALAAAHDADPSLRMANLLHAALVNGATPQDIGEMAAVGIGVAEELGAPLPGLLDDAARAELLG